MNPDVVILAAFGFGGFLAGVLFGGGLTHSVISAKLNAMALAMQNDFDDDDCDDSETWKGR
jgi:hypothetical protein